MNNSYKEYASKEYVDSLRMQADLSQNDPTAPDYVKGRTHWEEILEETIFVDNVEMTFSEGELTNTNPPFSSTFFSNGPDFYVLWDGTEYRCSTQSVSGAMLLGNASLHNMGSDSGEPFCIVSYPGGFQITGEVGTHTISIATRTEIIHTIAEKYLPKLNKIGYEGTGIASEVFNDNGSNIASGDFSHAEGHNTSASGDNAHAEGSGTTASGGSSHAEGGSSEASGNYSHAEGLDTQASDYCSHAEGESTKANGRCSHAEGENTVAGDSAHAEGIDTVAAYGGAHAEGWGTIAYWGSHVEGFYNIIDTEPVVTDRKKYAHIVGNGESDTERSNAHTLDWEGNAWYQGSLRLGGTSYDDARVVPSIPTANVGDTIKVKAVDENGIPTEWEAAPTGGGNVLKIFDDGTNFSSNMTFNEIIAHLDNKSLDYAVMYLYDPKGICQFAFLNDFRNYTVPCIHVRFDTEVMTYDCYIMSDGTIAKEDPNGR